MHIIRKEKLAQLLSQDKRIYRTSELATLWSITNRNTLLSTIQRYLKRGVLHHVVHGIYSTVSTDKLDLYEVGCAIAGPLSYISGETVLAIAGAIMQQPQKITLFGRKSKEFSFGGRSYWCRYLNPTFLSNRVGITTSGRAQFASTTRAFSDLKKINKILYLDNPKAIKYIKAEDPYVHSPS